MVKISRTDKRFTCLKTKTLAEAYILERYDLQEYIFNSREEFCKELGQELMIIGKEVLPSETKRPVRTLSIFTRAQTVSFGLDAKSIIAVSFGGKLQKWRLDGTLEWESRASH